MDTSIRERVRNCRRTTQTLRRENAVSRSQRRADWIHHQARIARQALDNEPAGIKRFMEENRKELQRYREKYGPIDDWGYAGEPRKSAS